MGRTLRYLATLAVLAVLAGYAVYMLIVARMAPDDGAAAQAEAIVVLTGGEARVETALRLLEEGRGERLLISGVAASDDDIRAMGPRDAARFDCCVDLDRVADSTMSNARESARWAHEHGYRRVLLVTHVYHMPRAKLELARAAPDVEFIPWPVGDWREPGLRLSILEYSKLVVVAGREGANRLRESL